MTELSFRIQGRNSVVVKGGSVRGGNHRLLESPSGHRCRCRYPEDVDLGYQQGVHLKWPGQLCDQEDGGCV